MTKGPTFGRIIYLRHSILFNCNEGHSKNSEYDQEIPQLQTADNPMTPRGRATQPSRDKKEDKEALTMRRIFSLADMITKAEFSNSPNVFKIRLFV